jgi:hypothetical protein
MGACFEVIVVERFQLSHRTHNPIPYSISQRLYPILPILADIHSVNEAIRGSVEGGGDGERETDFVDEGASGESPRRLNGW